MEDDSIDKGKTHEQEGSNADDSTRAKRLKLDVVPKDKACIICNCVKRKGLTKRYRICEKKRAKQLLLAMKYFKDDVDKRCVFLETVGDIFAADLVYHSNCLSNYILRFKRDIELLMNDKDDLDEAEGSDKIFKDLMENLDFQHHAIYISTLRDLMNAKFLEKSSGSYIHFMIIHTSRENLEFDIFLVEYIILKYSHERTIIALLRGVSVK